MFALCFDAPGKVTGASGLQGGALARGVLLFLLPVPIKQARGLLGLSS
jgi:hypothetical protein